jgi:membrane associated rhomboid family serine protease
MTDGIMNQTTQKKPSITIIQIIFCIVFCINFYLLSGNLSSLFAWNITEKEAALTNTGYFQPSDIFNGKLWGLITANFLHFNIFHLLFNIYWLYIFGQKIEKEVSQIEYLVIIISSGIIVSIFELAVSGALGVGYSGIGYALFGFIYVKAKSDSNFKDYLSSKTVNLFFIWLFLCVLTTLTSTVEVGNAAHFTGLFWGGLLAYLPKIKSNIIRYSLPISIFLISSISLFYAPWSISWLYNESYKYHTNQEYDKAKIIYHKILEKDSKNAFAKQNLVQIEIHELSIIANNLFDSQDFGSAKVMYKKILVLDPTSTFALENLKSLEEEIKEKENQK